MIQASKRFQNSNFYCIKDGFSFVLAIIFYLGVIDDDETTIMRQAS
jgi:hypothetical protein